jgi:hypothetical protein
MRSTRAARANSARRATRRGAGAPALTALTAPADRTARGRLAVIILAMTVARSLKPTRSSPPLQAAARALLTGVSGTLMLSVLCTAAPGRALAADPQVTVLQPAVPPAIPPKLQPAVPPKVQPTLAPTAGSKGTTTPQALLKQRSTAVLKQRTNTVLTERTTAVTTQRTSTVLKPRTTALGSSAAQPGKIIGGSRAPPPKTIVTRRILPN